MKAVIRDLFETVCLVVFFAMVCFIVASIFHYSFKLLFTGRLW